MNSFLRTWIVCVAMIYSATTYADHRFIIKLKPMAKPNEAAQELQKQGYKIKSHIDNVRMLVAEHPSASPQTPGFVEYIEPNYKIQVGAKIQGRYDEVDGLWNIDAIKAKKAWDIATGDRAVIIGISDTGIYKNHYDLNENIWKNPGETGLDPNGKDKSNNEIDDDQNGFVDDVWGWNFQANDNDPSDRHYHGTHVAGIAAAVGGNKEGIAGVAWKASIMGLKFLDREGTGDTADAVKSIVYAVDNGARVINCSWGTTSRPQALHDAISYALEKGVLIVAAAGNGSTDTDKEPHYPSAFEQDNIISVASIKDKKGKFGHYTNWGKESVDLAAPGFQIYSTFNIGYRIGDKHYYFYRLTGTSMAAPHVTGAAALLFSMNPQFTWKDVKALILQTVTPSGSWRNKSLTGGLLNLHSAVLAARE